MGCVQGEAYSKAIPRSIIVVQSVTGQVSSQQRLIGRQYNIPSFVLRIIAMDRIKVEEQESLPARASRGEGA